MGGTDISHETFRLGEPFPIADSPHSWLIAIAYWLAGGFIKSGLGNRIAYAIVAAFGKTSLGLVYSLVFAEVRPCSGCLMEAQEVL